MLTGIAIGAVIHGYVPQDFMAGFMGKDAWWAVPVMEKRLSCAAAGLGIRLEIDLRKDADALGILFQQTPAVLHDGKIAFRGLPRAEEIEVWLTGMARRQTNRCASFTLTNLI
ncbi:MAG: hypothetical protein Q8P42_14035 [Gallionella sp.]|nr:hypothetical protein [Gallionella sp.]